MNKFNFRVNVDKKVGRNTEVFNTNPCIKMKALLTT